MSRVPKPSRPRVLRPIVVGVAFLALATALTIVIARRAGDPTSGIKVQLGTDEFQVGSIDRFAKEIAANGTLLFAGLVGAAEQRPIGLFHSGDDPAKGWTAFSILVPGSSGRCVLALDRSTRRLVDPCTGTTYPPDGASLPTYATRIDDNRILYVDLRPPTATTSTSRA